MVRIGLPFSKKENAIVKRMEDYFTVVDKTVADFGSLLEAVSEGDAPAAQASFKATLDGETEADTVHRSLSMEIAEGAFFGGVREDILDLLEKMDSIADSAKDAARFLESKEELDDFALSILGSGAMERFVYDIRGAVSALGDLIAAFKLGKRELLARIPRVEEFEEAADDSKVVLMKELFGRGSEVNPLTVIQMRDFVLIADDIADSAEDASDVVLILAAKGYD